MGLKRTTGLVIALLIIWILCISLLRENLGVSIRLFNDDYDRGIYASHGEWYRKGEVPYRDVFSEYPQVPTYLFALPYFLIPGDTGELFGYYLYSTLFSFLMLVFLFGTIALLYKMLPERRRWLAFLMLLPASLYFTVNRFDILPAFLCLLSLLLLQRRQFVCSAVVLGIATLTKWYPLLLLPIYLSYDYTARRCLNWRMILAFGLTCLIIIAPTLLTGGLDALLVPYLFHAGRGVDMASLPGLVAFAMENWFNVNPAGPLWFGVFTILQVLIVPFSLFDRMDTFDEVLHWCILILAPFVLFSRIYSPQWLLWLMPMLLLAARTRKDILGIIFYDVSTYLAFPVTWDFFGHLSWEMKLMGLVTVVVLTGIAILAYRRARIHLSLNNFPLTFPTRSKT